MKKFRANPSTMAETNEKRNDDPPHKEPTRHPIKSDGASSIKAQLTADGNSSQSTHFKVNNSLRPIQNRKAPKSAAIIMARCNIIEH